jgi:hypothetical protein
MVRRSLWPKFGDRERIELLKSMEDTRRRTLVLGSSLQISSHRYRLCQDLHKVVDALAAV